MLSNYTSQINIKKKIKTCYADSCNELQELISKEIGFSTLAVMLNSYIAVPVDCMINFTEWSECRDGIRNKEGFIAQDAVGTGAPCPSPIPNIQEGNCYFKSNPIFYYTSCITPKSVYSLARPISAPLYLRATELYSNKCRSSGEPSATL